MDTKTTFPLYSPGINCESNKNINLLVADLRKENSTLTIFKCENGNLNLQDEKVYVTDNFSSFAELAKTFLKDTGKEVERIAVGVPGPVIKGTCETPNLPWKLDQEKIKSETGVSKAYLINDLEAVAYSLATVDEKRFEILHTSPNKSKGNVAILAPGNGLGEAGLFWDGESLRPFATEGGHTEFSPRNDFEVEFYQFLNKIYGIVTWENVLSKEGFYNIYRFLRDIGRHKEDEWLTERIQKEDFLTLISEVGKDNSSRLVKLSVEMFLEFLAREANNLVLKLKATGGLIITGEISDKIYELVDKKKFYKDFKISDRMEHLLKDIPIYFLRNEKEILQGAAFYGAFIED